MKSKSLNILHISDTHGFHGYLNLNTEDIDVIIHSGDCSNYSDLYKNHEEVYNFYTWYSSLDIPYKIYVAGNHDTSIEQKIFNKDLFELEGIMYLEDEAIEINGFKIYGSPYSPTYGNWSFMKSRNKIHKVWDKIPDNTEILITHSPAKGLQDISERYDGTLEFCGCNNLRKQLNRLEKLKLHCFGHIHNRELISNSGVLTLPNGLISSNAAAVEDGNFDGTIVNHGNIIKLTKEE